MRRPAFLTLIALGLLLAIFPLTLPKPGTPPTLKADEAAYVMMAQSLAYDGDLRVEPKDLERIFEEFPYRDVSNLILMTDDGWQTVFYGKPYLYSLTAAPLVRLFGANGLLCWNMLLLLAMVWMGSLYLQRFNAPWLATLFAAGFFFASASFAYVFWLQPEIFQMTAVTASLFFGLHRLEDAVAPRTWHNAALSGAVLMAAAYGKPMLAVLALPVWIGLARRRQWRALVAWGLGALLAVGVITGVAVALTGHPSAYLGVERLGVTVCDPDVMPVEPQPPEGRIGPGTDRPTGGAWSWIFQPPPVPLAELAENIGYFLWGRHTGLFLYFPFALLALLLFVTTGGGRTLERWALLASLAAVALLFLILVAHNWHGGGGFVGNRYYVNAYPAFLFLVTRLRGGRATLVGFALGGLFLGTLLLSPFGRSAPEPTLQSHVRGAPFRFFPRELSLREIPGYRQQSVGPYTLSARSDQFLPRGETAWLTGASDVEIWIVGEEPFESATFLVGAPETANRIELRLGDDHQAVELVAGERRRITLRPGGADRVRSQSGHRFYVYRLHVESEGGRARAWTRYYPPPRCERFAYNESIEETWFLGAELTMLGTGDLLGGDAGDGQHAEPARDPFAVRWGQIEVPQQWPAGATRELPVRLFNASEVAWENRGAARVKLAYRWRSADGAAASADDQRTELPLPVAPGGRVAVRSEITAPADPGRYTLELDLVYEHVAWFADRTGGESFRAPVEVVPAGEPGGLEGSDTRVLEPALVEPTGSSPSPTEDEAMGDSEV